MNQNAFSVLESINTDSMVERAGFNNALGACSDIGASNSLHTDGGLIINGGTLVQHSDVAVVSTPISVAGLSNSLSASGLRIPVENGLEVTLEVDVVPDASSPILVNLPSEAELDKEMQSPLLPKKNKGKGRGAAPQGQGGVEIKNVND